MTNYSDWQKLLRERITEGIRAWVTAEAHRTGMDTLMHQKAFSRVRFPQCSKPLPAYLCLDPSLPIVANHMRSDRVSGITTTASSAVSVVRPRLGVRAAGRHFNALLVCPGPSGC
jgi:hypothetical protein